MNETQSMHKPSQKMIYINLLSAGGAVFLLMLFFFGSVLQAITQISSEGQGLNILIYLTMFLLIGGVAYIISYLKYKYYFYQITEGNLRILEGIIMRKDTLIPLKKIQNVEIYQGIIERIFGVCIVRFHTAGTMMAKAEGYIPSVEKEEAHRIREKIMEYNENRQQNQG